MKTSLNNSVNLLIILIFFLMASCQKSIYEGMDSTIPGHYPKTSSLDSIISQDTCFINLFNLSCDYVGEAIDSDADTALYKDYLINKNFTGIQSLLHLTTSEYDSYNNLAQSYYDCLYQRYGSLIPPCDSCTTDSIEKANVAIRYMQLFKENPALLDSLRNNIFKKDGTSRPPGCMWAAYTACLIVCGAAVPVPVLSGLCMFGCYCSYCWGDLHDYLCGPVSGK